MNWKLMYSKKYRYERLLMEVKMKEEIKKDLQKSHIAEAEKPVKK
jgi:hypothetical protein